jgi:hypothetical protein
MMLPPVSSPMPKILSNAGPDPIRDEQLASAQPDRMTRLPVVGSTRTTELIAEFTHRSVTRMWPSVSRSARRGAKKALPVPTTLEQSASEHPESSVRAPLAGSTASSARLPMFVTRITPFVPRATPSGAARSGPLPRSGDELIARLRPSARRA